MGEGSGTGLMSMSVGGGGWDAEMSVASLGVNCVSEASLGENCVSEASLGGVVNKFRRTHGNNDN